MRIFLIIILLGVGIWQGVVDWQATIGEGYAYRLTSIGEALAETWPERFARDEDAARSFLDWVLAIPIAAALLVAAGMVWLTRPRRR